MKVFSSRFIVVTGLFGLVYKIMPDVDLEWRDVTLRALITSLLFNSRKRGYISGENRPRLHLWRRQLLDGLPVASCGVNS